MLFSKFILPVFGLLSVASFAFATPVATVDETAVVARDVDVTNVLSLVQGLESSLNNMLNSNQQGRTIYTTRWLTSLTASS